jgi:hypothetical protein
MPKGHSKHRILLFPRFGRAGKRFSAILLSYHHQKIGGGGRDRTDDLRLAKPALSQLSYAPADTTVQKHNQIRRMVGLGRFELPTSRLSSARSNQLSYRPLTTDQKHLQVPPKNRQTEVLARPSEPSKKLGADSTRTWKGYEDGDAWVLIRLASIGIASNASILRKEVIQPQVPLRLPCYDFTPVADLTVACCLKS